MPKEYDPHGQYAVTIVGPSYTGLIMWAEGGATLSVHTQPQSGTLESGPLCSGKSAISHNGRSAKVGGQFQFTTSASGDIRFVAIILGSRSGSECHYEVIELSIPASTHPPSTTTTRANTTAPTTTTATQVHTPGSTQVHTPGSTHEPDACAQCYDEANLLTVGLDGSPRWCHCCAHDCEGIFPSCVKKGFCSSFCYEMEHCAPWTTGASTATIANSTAVANTTTASQTSEPQQQETSSGQHVAAVMSSLIVSTVALFV
jgi:hypothetical protein